ncbi:sulfatase-like hydrolase/transferase [Prosthecobacter sp.]|uniref:sulfatase-like hydrolase/transferase n=1 Tax=Prosthecobacter sp. TaxID=1965333 RepID=UPI003784EC32
MTPLPFSNPAATSVDAFRLIRPVVVALGIWALFAGGVVRASTAARPNVLFIAVDDLNDWVGCLGGHAQTRTPNIDRLAKSGVLFTNAHCSAPSCNPSRTAVFSGVPPWRSGLYNNGQKLRDVLPQAELLPRHFSNNGYWSAGSGKLLHYIIDPKSWDEYFPEKAKDNPFPRTFDPPKRPISLPVGGPWQYVETDWGELDISDQEFGGDHLVAKWIGEQLARTHEKPFFLGCGIYKPHEPWFLPKAYFEPFPLESIQPGPGWKEDDLDDVPPAGQQLARNRYFPHIQKEGQWKKGIQAYLAAIHYSDAMVGRVLDALEKSPARDNTIVVLWSDHGWHLGEKEHWQKYTGWRLCTRVPLIIRVPKGAPGLPGGTSRGSVCDRAVSLTDLFPTLTNLCGLPASRNEGGSERSLVPLLRDPDATWPHAAVTQMQSPGAYSVSRDHWRYIHYANGEEELYDIAADPHEWTNLLHGEATPEHRSRAAELRALAPAHPAPVPEVPLASMTSLTWHPASEGPTPPSKPDGNPFDVTFINADEQNVELFWMSPEGESRSYGQIEPTKTRRQQTRPGAVWEIRSAVGMRLGHFVIGDRAAKAVIPKGEAARVRNVRR